MPIRRPNSHYRSREHLTWAEVQTLIASVGERGRHRLRDQALILLSFRHGLRPREAVQLRRDALMLPSSIFIHRLKGSTSGAHPLQDDEVTLLRELLALYPDSEFVFVNERGGCLSTDAVRKMLQRSLGNCSINIKVHPHMFRHSCGFYLAEQNIATRDIQEYLGHKSINNTVIYTAANAARFSRFEWAGLS